MALLAPAGYSKRLTDHYKEYKAGLAKRILYSGYSPPSQYGIEKCRPSANLGSNLDCTYHIHGQVIQLLIARKRTTLRTGFAKKRFSPHSDVDQTPYRAWPEELPTKPNDRDMPIQPFWFAQCSRWSSVLPTQSITPESYLCQITFLRFVLAVGR